jgi:hypothetical protein
VKRAHGGRRTRRLRPIVVAAFNVDPVEKLFWLRTSHRDKIQDVWTLSVRAKTEGVYERIRMAGVP